MPRAVVEGLAEAQAETLFAVVTPQELVAFTAVEGEWRQDIRIAAGVLVVLVLGATQELEQSASFGPVVQDHSHQLERVTNNETIHTN
jgi:hypothetical protein